MKQIKFTAELITKEKGGTYVICPSNTVEIFGKKGQVKIKADIEGISYQGSIIPTGKGTHYLGIKKSILQKINKKAGDNVIITIKEDLDERKVNLPDDFIKALSDYPSAKQRFDKFSYSHKNEMIEWIKEAKKSETRNRRIQKAIDMLLEKK